MGGSNFCIEIWRDDKGRWNGDVVSTYKAYQTIRALGEQEGRRRLSDQFHALSGKPLVMRLHNDDLVRLNLIDFEYTMRVVKISGNGQIYFAEQREANVAARNADKDDPFSYISKMAGSLQNAKARRVIVSEIGVLKDLSLIHI